MAFSKLQTKLGTKSMLKKQKKNQEDLEVCVGADLNFAGAEAFKLLRTNISFSFPDASGCRIIGVTSSVRGEGKTLISLNLAYSIAQQNENRVLLIEGDMRLPTFSKKTDLKPTPGLSNLFAGMAFEDAVQHFADRMDVLSCGDIPPNPSELLSSQKMEAMLQDFANRYDFIIVDLPPVIDVSDALAVSKYLDGMILVLRHAHSKRREVLEAVRQLKFVNTHIVGFIYNGYGKKSSKRRSYYRSNYSSYQTKPTANSAAAAQEESKQQTE
jgi:capsular exopolysaccharide synthesis family protein